MAPRFFFLAQDEARMDPRALPFRLVGLTGGIACGKSAVSKLLRSAQLRVIDADVVAREVVEPQSPGLAAVVEAFGPQVLDAQGCLDRPKLGALVFGDEASRRRLNGILHPLIAQRTAELTQAAQAEGEPLVVYEAPLLVENGLHLGMDKVIVVTAREEVQLARLMARDGLDEGQARQRIAAQLPLAQKVAVAHAVVDNSGDLADTRRQVAALLGRLPGLLWPEAPRDALPTFTLPEVTP
jgi:dephospho-CoA kinase